MLMPYVLIKISETILIKVSVFPLLTVLINVANWKALILKVYMTLPSGSERHKE